MLLVCLFVFFIIIIIIIFIIIINGLNIFYLLLIPAHSSSTSGWTRMHTIYYTVSTLKRSAESEGHNMRKKLGRFDQYSTYRPGFWPGSCSCHDEQNSCFQVHNRNLHWTTIQDWVRILIFCKDLGSIHNLSTGWAMIISSFFPFIFLKPPW